MGLSERYKGVEENQSVSIRKDRKEEKGQPICLGHCLNYIKEWRDKSEDSTKGHHIEMKVG